MKKIKGITEYVKRNLSKEDLEDLENMIGCEVFKSVEKDCYDLPDGISTHKDFLIIELK